ncbi:GDSL esterase/lipase 7-like [Durio zibethinus]|uniref:GDSL esterase/lipase 7-like n=1 Tax=Durio zibethinus TaxID=66656 RepID=A0A6P6AXC7_DURZI|nr:GDSL esterase/lipase 7-like [Durio zibethinus]
MYFSCSICVFIIPSLFQSFTFSSGDVLVTPPPFTINQTALLQYLSLGNITIDLPALYVFGDSFVDPGNNNFLNTSIKSNYTPYGIDFEGMPSGRTTNGRTVVDFIAQVVGLPFPPPALDVSEAKKNSRTGVNYGSASGGILPSPPLVENLFGHVLSMDEQIAFFENTTKDLKCQFNNAESFAQHLSKSLFFFHVGGNDLGLYWDLERHSNYSAQKYSQLLIDELSMQLQKLYELGVRKFFVNNVSPMGCQPYSIVVEKPKTTQCVEEMNARIVNFNKQIPPLLSHLQSTLPGSKFVLGDLYKIYEDVFASPASYGFTNVKKSCCIDPFRNQTRPCAPNVEPCKERNQHVFFDPYHPSENMHFVIARRFLKDSSVSSPINLLQLIQS